MPIPFCNCIQQQISYYAYYIVNASLVCIWYITVLMPCLRPTPMPIPFPDADPHILYHVSINRVLDSGHRTRII